MQSPRFKICSRLLLSSKASLFLSCSQTGGYEQISAPICTQNICLTSSCWYKSGLYFYRHRSMSAWSGGCVEIQLLLHEQWLRNRNGRMWRRSAQKPTSISLFGPIAVVPRIWNEIPQKKENKQDRKIRTVNKNKPPTGKKKSAQKIYNTPERARTFIQMYNKHRVEKVIKKGKVVKEVLCTPLYRVCSWLVVQSFNTLDSLMCRQDSSWLSGPSHPAVFWKVFCTLPHLGILCWGRIHSFTNISCSGKTFLSVAW